MTDHLLLVLPLLGLAFIGARLYRHLVEEPREPSASDRYVAQLREKHKRAALQAANRGLRG